MIDMLLLAVIAGVTWCVASEGAWGSALSFLSVLIGGLLAMNFFEGLAGVLQSSVASSTEWSHRWDIVAFLGLFSVFTFGLRALTEKIMPTFVQVHPIAFNVARWAFGAMTGYVTAAILLTAVHVAPLPRNWGGFTPERNNLLDFAAPDRQWLAYTQHVSEKIFIKGEYGPIFDGDVFEGIKGDPQTRDVWSSFPIRYAMRREQFYRPAPVSSAAPPTSGPPQQSGQPNGQPPGEPSSGF